MQNNIYAWHGENGDFYNYIAINMHHTRAEAASQK
jgi:hypothetical protein